MAVGVGLPGGKKVPAFLSICVWVAAWVLVVAAYNGIEAQPKGARFIDWTVPYFAVIGLALGVIVLLAFWAFLGVAAVSDQRMRTALAAALVTFYVSFTIFLVTVPGFADTLLDISALSGGADAAAQAAGQAATDQKPFGQTIFEGLTGFVGVVLAFYFATAAVEKVTEVASDASKDKAQTKAQADMAVATANAATAEAERAAEEMRLANTLAAKGVDPAEVTGLVRSMSR